jgi:Glutathionylspermidine synthase preATP-grasp
MQRLPQDPRPDRRERARRLSFAFAEIEGEPYWDETAYYRFTAAEIDTLEAATAELEARMREATDYAVRNDFNGPLGTRPAPGRWSSAPGRSRSPRSTAGWTCAGTGPARRSCWNTTPTRRPRCSRPGEPPRICRRPFCLRGWSDDEEDIEPVFA